MASNMNNIRKCLSLFLTLALTSSIVSAIPTQEVLLKRLKLLNKPHVKSIKSFDGDIIDCVKLAHQPTFDHPLLKNHKIQLSPTFYPEITFFNTSKHSKGELAISQLWHRRGSCPDGTVPIKRTRKSDLLREIAFTHKNLSTNSLPRSEIGNEQAIGYVNGGNYLGTGADLNVWQPQVFGKSEYSKSQIWVQGKYNAPADSLEAGWHVSHVVNGDRRTRLFAFWTNDGYKAGCYNHRCPGFVQVSKSIALGTVFDDVSTYGGDAHEFNLAIYKDLQTGNWWLVNYQEFIGYWPSSLFSFLKKAASVIQWGGVIQNDQAMFTHTTTQMGSGHFADEGFDKASYMKNIFIVGEDGKAKELPDRVPTIVSRPDCYNIKPFVHGSPNFGTYFYFGGPGKQANSCIN